jgi:Type II CAAX prenyl endopeptidase Rce1-like
MSPKLKLFLIIWLAGLAGILSFLLIDLNELLPRIFENFPLAERPEIPEFTPVLKVLSLIQPTIIMSLAVITGVGLARKVGLHAPASEALAGASKSGSEKFWPALRPQIVPGILGGVCGGLAVVSASAISRSFLSPETVTRIAEFGKLLPVATRLLYGGILEEVLLRWGLMTLLVWIAWRVFQKGQDKPKAAYFIAAILISSVIFGIGHLPIALMLFPPTLALIIFVVIANSMFGLIAGYLYWKKGLESAIIAHMLCHVTMLAASYLRAYF